MKQRPIDYAEKVLGDADGLYLLVVTIMRMDCEVISTRRHISYVVQPSESGRTRFDFDPMVGVAELRVALRRYADLSSDKR